MQSCSHTLREIFNSALEDPNLTQAERQEIVDIQQYAARTARRQAGDSARIEASYDDLLRAQLQRYMGHIEYIRGRAANRNARPAERF